MFRLHNAISRWTLAAMVLTIIWRMSPWTWTTKHVGVVTTWIRIFYLRCAIFCQIKRNIRKRTECITTIFRLLRKEYIFNVRCPFNRHSADDLTPCRLPSPACYWCSSLQPPVYLLLQSPRCLLSGVLQLLHQGVNNSKGPHSVDRLLQVHTPWSLVTFLFLLRKFNIFRFVSNTRHYFFSPKRRPKNERLYLSLKV